MAHQQHRVGIYNKQRRAVEAFLGGHISYGKLAEEMGQDVWQTREGLAEHNIPENSSVAEAGLNNA